MRSPLSTSRLLSARPMNAPAGRVPGLRDRHRRGVRRERVEVDEITGGRPVDALGRTRRGDALLVDDRHVLDLDVLRVPVRIRRGQLELRVNDDLPDPTQRILAYCEFGRISTLATATLRELGYQRAAALDGGMKSWREAGYPLNSGSEP